MISTILHVVYELHLESIVARRKVEKTTKSYESPNAISLVQQCGHKLSLCTEPRNIRQLGQDAIQSLMVVVIEREEQFARQGTSKETDRGVWRTATPAQRGYLTRYRFNRDKRVRAARL